MKQLPVVVRDWIYLDMRLLDSTILSFLQQLFTRKVFNHAVFFGNRNQPVEKFIDITSVEIEFPFLKVPRGGYKKLSDFLRSNGYILSFYDFRILVSQTERIERNTSIKLESYQESAVSDLYSCFQKLLISPTGSGKTVMALELIYRLKQKTIILVHTDVLFTQWIKRIKEFFPRYSPGIIKAGEIKLKDITIASLPSIFAMDRGELTTLYNYFGCVIADECQHSGALSSFRTINNFPAKYRYGLTALEKRKDGMEFLVYDTISPDKYEVDPDSVASRVMPFHYKFLPIELDNAGYLAGLPDDVFPDWNEVLNVICGNMARNDLIVEYTMRLSKNGHRVLILSERVEHCDYLYGRLRSVGVRVSLILGRDSSKTRKAIIKNIINGKTDVLVSTRGCSGEGMDIPVLSSLILATPWNNYSIVKQAVGRISRVHKSKTENIVIDFEDIGIKHLERTMKNRLKFYKKMGGFEYAQIL